MMDKYSSNLYILFNGFENEYFAVQQYLIDNEINFNQFKEKSYGLRKCCQQMIFYTTTNQDKEIHKIIQNIKKQKSRKCLSCGKIQNVNDNYCSNCGNNLKLSEFKTMFVEF